MLFKRIACKKQFIKCHQENIEEVDVLTFLKKFPEQIITHGTFDYEQKRTCFDMIRYVINNTPHVAAKQIYTNSNSYDLWAPIGLILVGGIITSCSEWSDIDSSGRRFPVLERPEFKEMTLIEKLSQRKGYEIAIKQPKCGALYLHDVDYAALPNINKKTLLELGEELGIPVVLFKTITDLFDLYKQLIISW